jgi:hypothetical protein
MQNASYAGYFDTCSIILSLTIPVYFLLEREENPFAGALEFVKDNLMIPFCVSHGDCVLYENRETLTSFEISTLPVGGDLIISLATS